MKKILFTNDAPQAIGPYSQATAAGDLVFISGQLGVDPVSGQFPEGGVSAQTEQSLKNVGAILKQAGLDYANVLKTTVFITSMSDFADVNAVYSKYFTDAYPARSCVAVKELPKGGLVEIEVIASK